MTIAIYPGTFDPVTNGHLDIATRAAKIFEKLVIGVYEAPNKHPLFSTEERVSMFKLAVSSLPNVEVQPFYGLTIDFARKTGALAMVRGLRMSADFEREFDMAMMNKKLYPCLELVCLMASAEFQFLSSTLLKEAAELGGNITNLVPPYVVTALKNKVKTRV